MILINITITLYKILVRTNNYYDNSYVEDIISIGLKNSGTYGRIVICKDIVISSIVIGRFCCIPYLLDVPCLSLDIGGHKRRFLLSRMRGRRASPSLTYKNRFKSIDTHPSVGVCIGSFPRILSAKRTCSKNLKARSGILICNGRTSSTQSLIARCRKTVLVDGEGEIQPAGINSIVL